MTRPSIGVIGYCPPRGKLGSDAFLRNISRYRTETGIYLFSDDASLKLSKNIPNPEEMVNHRARFSLNNLLFFMAVSFAKEAGLDYMLYLESDCRVGCDGWDSRMLNEAQDRYGGTRLCVGSPVVFDVSSGGRDVSKRIIAEACAYQNEGGIPMAMYGSKSPQDTSGVTYYVNGALGIYSVKGVYSLFPDLDINLVNLANRSQPWDLELGRRMWSQFGPGVVDKVGWITSAYSAYANAVTSEMERAVMLRDAIKVGVHQIKTNVEI